MGFILHDLPGQPHDTRLGSCTTSLVLVAAWLVHKRRQPQNIWSNLPQNVEALASRTFMLPNDRGNVAARGGHVGDKLHRGGTERSQRLAQQPGALCRLKVLTRVERVVVRAAPVVFGTGPDDHKQPRLARAPPAMQTASRGWRTTGPSGAAGCLEVALLLAPTDECRTIGGRHRNDSVCACMMWTHGYSCADTRAPPLMFNRCRSMCGGARSSTSGNVGHGNRHVTAAHRNGRARRPVLLHAAVAAKAEVAFHRPWPRWTDLLSLRGLHVRPGHAAERSATQLTATLCTESDRLARAEQAATMAFELQLNVLGSRVQVVHARPCRTVLDVGRAGIHSSERVPPHDAIIGKHAARKRIPQSAKFPTRNAC
eukprot:2063394-Prymnesium_polylepis.3